MKSVVAEFQKNGWEFIYDSDTRFIGVYHPRGGKQSICEIVHPFESDAFGYALAEFLNNPLRLTNAIHADGSQDATCSHCGRVGDDRISECYLF